jgi:hypothetical protein
LIHRLLDGFPGFRSVLVFLSHVFALPLWLCCVAF